MSSLPVASISGYLVKYENGHRYVVYNISIVFLDHQWSINRRFSEFVKLNKSFTVSQRSLLPRFPSKVIFHKNLSVIESRKVAFQSYLNALLHHKSLVKRDTVQAFLCIPATLMEKFYESQASQDKRNGATIGTQESDYQEATSHEFLSNEESMPTESQQKDISITIEETSNSEYFSTQPNNFTNETNVLKEDLAANTASTSDRIKVDSNKLSASNRTSTDSTKLSTENLQIKIFGPNEFIDIPCFECKVISSYQACHDGEFTVSPNETVLVYVQGENWCLVSKIATSGGTKMGFVPTYVLSTNNIMRSPNAEGFSIPVANNIGSEGILPRITSLRANNLTTVLYDYTPLQEDEISVSSGELVHIIREDRATDRFEVELVDQSNNVSDKRRGWISSDFVEKPKIIRRRQSLLR